MKWQPIETAPRDCKDFLCCYAPYPIYGVGYWCGPHATPFARDSVGEAFEPTHWMPLPEPPK